MQKSFEGFIGLLNSAKGWWTFYLNLWAVKMMLVRKNVAEFDLIFVVFQGYVSALALAEFAFETHAQCEEVLVW